MARPDALRSALLLPVVALGVLSAACSDGVLAPTPTSTLTALPTASPTATATAAPLGEDGHERIEVRIDGLVIEAEVARTSEERAQGLSGRSALPESAGMLFVFQEERRPGFWMKGMRFPLDFIWISRDRRVVDITRDVPPPEPGTLDGALPLYQPAEPVLYVLEVNAGIVGEAGLRVGDAVTFEPEVAEEGAP